MQWHSKQWQSIQSFEPLKTLGDPRRRAILRLLMAGPATLTQLGRHLDLHPAKVRHHLKQLEKAGLVALISTKVVGGFVEKYYQATAGAFTVNLSIVPQSGKAKSIVAMGSHDLALELLARHFQEADQTPDLFAVPVGSLDGLIALRQGACQLAGCHLLDSHSGDYNRSYVQHLFPGEDMMLVTLTSRQQGLLVRPGNPLQIHDLGDLARQDVVFVNRKRGAGTRLWLDQQLRQLNIRPSQVRGYQRQVNTHLQVAQAVADGTADVGLAVLAAARPFDLDFIPLFEERYDLVMPAAETTDPLLHPLLDHLQTAVFRRAVAALTGYNPLHTGEEHTIGG